ncbi:MAG: amidohydrolase family protein, partial [Acidobacteriota bacterium]|jgi:hypothetical protein|nr:amidohydrolase family protein [Acidobacteriota bacterium]
MLDLDIPVGAGTDATRVASYNPWVALYWLTTGRTVDGMPMYGDDNRLSRAEALRLYTQGSSWFSADSGKKGAIAPGQFADFAILTDDYFSVPDEKVKGIESVLTVVDGKVVHAAQEFAFFAPPPLPVLPEWSPIKVFGGYGAPLDAKKAARVGVAMPVEAACHGGHCHHSAHNTAQNPYAGFFGLGCDCFAF